MVLSRRVSLNGAELDEIDPRIVITGIDEAEGNETADTAETAAGDGMRVTRKRRNFLDVTVRFAMDIHKKELQERSELLERVNRWAANGGTLRVNYKPERKILVALQKAPGAGDLFRWTNDYAIVFRAFQVPYWVDETSVTVSSSVTAGGSFQIEVGGSAETVADFTVENRSGKAINSVSLQIGGNAMQLSAENLLPAGQTITIDHPENLRGPSVIRIRNGNGSIMKYRTGANDFYCRPGTNTVTFSAQRAVRVTAMVRGRYL